METPPRPSPHPVPLTIGWREYVAIPEWGLTFLRAKSDTGARTSAIDVADVIELPNNRVRFHVVLSRPGATRRRLKTVEAAVVRRTRVRSSFGTVRDRITVRVTLVIGPVTKPVELGLVSRRRMLCRVLLGRRALGPEFVVDPGRAYLLGRRPRRLTAGHDGLVV